MNIFFNLSFLLRNPINADLRIFKTGIGQLIQFSCFILLGSFKNIIFETSIIFNKIDIIQSKFENILRNFDENVCDDELQVLITFKARSTIGIDAKLAFSSHLRRETTSPMLF